MTLHRMFHYDPGHAWLQVPKTDLAKYKIKGISNYSHQDEDFAYLEEDCDAPIYIKTLADLNIAISISELEDRIGIRDLPRFEKEV